MSTAMFIVAIGAGLVVAVQWDALPGWARIAGIAVAAIAAAGGIAESIWGFRGMGDNARRHGLLDSDDEEP